MTSGVSDRVLLNAGALVGSRLIVALFGWGGTVLVVRTLGPEDFGRFSFVFSLLSLLSIVTSLGVSRVALVGILHAKGAGDRVAGAYILLRSGLGVIGYLVAVSFVVIGGYDTVVVRAVAVAGIVVLLATPSSAMNVVFQATGRMTVVALAGAIGQFAQLGLTVALVLGPGTLVWLTVPAVLNEVLALLLKYRAARHLMPIRLVADVRLWKSMVREALPLTIGHALETLYFRVDMMMLSRMASFSAVGSYGVGVKFSDLVDIVPWALTTVMLPILVAAWPSDMERFSQTVREALRILAFLAGLAVGTFIAFAEPLLTLLFGSEFVDGALPATLLVTAQTCAFGSSVAFACLVASNRHGLYPLVSLVGLMLNVGLNLLLIPRYSITGAATASLASLTMVTFLMGWLAIRLPGVRLAMPVRIAWVVPAAGALALVGGLLRATIPWPVAGVIAVSVYIALSLLLGVITMEQVKRLAKGELA